MRAYVGWVKLFDSNKQPSYTGGIEKRRQMTIKLSPEQERAIQAAIKSGFVRSVDEFIEIAIAKLPRPQDHSEESRRESIRRMEEFGERYHLSLGEPVTRKLLHEGHRY